MTPAEKFAKSLTNLQATPMEREAADMIRRLAAALKDYDEAWDRRDILAMRHADALKDIKDE